MTSPSFGRLDAPYLLVVLAPMSRAQWKWVWDLLHDDVGVDKTQCRVVFLLDEQPAGANERPTKPQLDRNRDRFVHEMAESAPRVVVPFGPDAFRAVTGLTVGIEDARGYVLGPRYRGVVVSTEIQQVGVYKNASKATGAAKGDPKFKRVKVPKPPPLPIGFNGPVIPVYSPRQVEKSGYRLMFALKADLMRASEMTWTNWPEYMHDHMFTYETLLGADFDSELLAFDFETMGKGSDVIERISFSDGHRSTTLPWDADVKDFTLKQLLVPDRLLVLHNSMFDLRILKVNGMDLLGKIKVFDTMLSSVILQPDLPKGLGKVASLYLNVEPWKWKTLQQENWELYSAKDSWAAARIALRQIELMKEVY